MKFKNYFIIKHLGKGAYGDVYKAKKLYDTTHLYAIKRMKVTINVEESKNIINEIKILKFANCPYILSMNEIFLIHSTIFLVTPYANKGDLYQIIKKQKKTNFSENVIWNYFIQISLGVLYLHNNNIIHRDLKTSNIFVNHVNGMDTILIGDFGVAKIIQLSKKSSTIIGTPLYMSPELFKQEVYNKKTDIWSLGCVLYELIELKPPFLANTIENLSRKIQRGKYCSMGKLYSIELTNFIHHMLVTDVKKRYSIHAILEDKEIKKRLYQVPYTEEHFNEINPILYKRVNIPKTIRDWKYLASKNFNFGEKNHNQNKLLPPIKNKNNVKQHYRYNFNQNQKNHNLPKPQQQQQHQQKRHRHKKSPKPENYYQQHQQKRHRHKKSPKPENYYQQHQQKRHRHKKSPKLCDKEPQQCQSETNKLQKLQDKIETIKNKMYVIQNKIDKKIYKKNNKKKQILQQDKSEDIFHEKSQTPSNNYEIYLRNKKKKKYVSSFMSNLYYDKLLVKIGSKHETKYKKSIDFQPNKYIHHKRRRNKQGVKRCKLPKII